MSRGGRMAHRRSELLTDFVAHAEQLLVQHGVRDGDAMSAANALADFLVQHWGGQMISIPLNFQRRLEQRELEIYRAFTGDNYDQIARMFNMTESGARRLVNRVRAKITAAMAGNQLDLLDSADQD